MKDVLSARDEQLEAKMQAQMAEIERKESQMRQL